MGFREMMPEAIPGPMAFIYSLGPGNLGRRAQRRLAGLVDEVLPGDARLVVDVGCGPGWLAISLAQARPGLQVVAVDLSRSMTRIARRNLRRLGLANVEVREENASRLSLSDGAADLVVSAESMHHWREPVAVLDEMHRALRPGGRAWIFDGRNDFEPQEVVGWVPLWRRPPPRPALAVLRAVLGTHGFSTADWQTRVPELAATSRFGGGSIEAIGIYRRLEMIRK